MNPASEPHPLTEFSENFYLTYPHSNSFVDQGRAMVIGRLGDAGFELVLQNLVDDSRESLCRIPAPSDLTAPPFSREGSNASSATRAIFWDATLNAESPYLVIGEREGVWGLDLNRRGEPDLLFRPSPGETLSPLLSLTADGKRVLINYHSSDLQNHGAVELDRLTGHVLPVLKESWWANHFHYCPQDEEWIGYCHEGLTELVPDRVWGLHRTKLPGGRMLFDQHWDTPGKQLFVGHERWCFHAPTVLAVAYGVSPGQPRGIYEVFTDERPPRLVSEGNRDWHVGVSQDGRWAVVDTTGPYEAPGIGWDNAGLWSDIILLDMKTGRRQFLARSRHIRHPSHPHPVFSPDGQFVFYNEVDESLKNNRIMRVRNLWQ